MYDRNADCDVPATFQVSEEMGALFLIVPM